MRRWSTLGGITCKTYDGQSVVDYVICSQSFTSRLLKFDIGDCSIEIKYDHAPLFVKMDFAHSSPHNMKNLGIQNKSLFKGKILINQENKERFSAALKQQFQTIEHGVGNKTTNEVGCHVHCRFVIPIIPKALSACKRSQPKKGDASTFMANPWYDEECKATKRSIKERNWSQVNKKKYEKLV